MKGTIHKIHDYYDMWMFKTYEQVGKDLIPKRFPLISENEKLIDGMEIIGDIVIVEGIEKIKIRG
jgi:hypothetical protein